MRRQFKISEEDEECLVARSLSWESVIENNTKWLILLQYPIPEGYNQRQATAALRISPSYPDDQIDMVYFYPALSLLNSKKINALSPFVIDGNEYQQWSRHRRPGEWRPGVDNICTHLLLVDNWLKNELRI